jgi:hypothetical protein
MVFLFFDEFDEVVLEIGEWREVDSEGIEDLATVGATLPVAAVVPAVLPAESTDFEESLFELLDLSLGDSEVQGSSGKGLVDDGLAPLLPVAFPGEAKIVCEKVEHPRGKASPLPCSLGETKEVIAVDCRGKPLPSFIDLQ